jgi:type I restriction enzyme S subunit
MTLTRVKLGDLLSVKHGFAFKSEYFDTEGPFILMTPGHFHDAGGFRDQGAKTKYYTGDVPNGYLLDEGELLVAMTEQMEGLLGSSALVPESGRYLHNQRLGRIVELDDTRLDKRYLYYLFNTREVRAQVVASASGTKVRHTSPSRIGEVFVDIPPVAVQSRVASILAAYDDLIENNTRRIKLLEDAARLLYEEWFVRLRFPGHEHTPIHNGVPEGWRQGVLGDLVAIHRGKNITRQTAELGQVPVVAGGLEPAYFHSTANAVSPVITISASGANAGYVNCYLQDIWASDCSFISVDDTPHIYYFYLLLKHRQSEIFAMQRGAAQPHVYPKDLSRLSVTHPTQTILRHFTDAIDPIYSLMATLVAQNRHLRAARDLLLPRLMTGEVAV